MLKRFSINVKLYFGIPLLTQSVKNVQKTCNQNAKNLHLFCQWGHEFYLKPYINKKIKIFALRILNALNAKWVPRLIKATGIYCFYHDSGQLICSQFEHDTSLQLEHMFLHTTYCHQVQFFVWNLFGSHISLSSGNLVVLFPWSY